jgi:hypothetical protein
MDQNNRPRRCANGTTSDVAGLLAHLDNSAKVSSRRGPSERGREIIALRQAGMKQVAIAVRLDLTVGAVKQVLRRNRRRNFQGTVAPR